MDHHKGGMDVKWRRHYRETTSTLSVALILFGTCFLLALGFIWPQHYSAIVFNSKMEYRTIVDAKDYWTCDPDYINFVFDEPTVDEALLQMYVYNVTNPKDVMQVGYKPKMRETGPYGYRLINHKYDVSFQSPNISAFANETDSTSVYFREFSLIEESHDVMACERWFYKTDRTSRTDDLDPCANQKCQCKSHNATVLIINPMFLKLIYKESSTALIAEWSADIFAQVRETMTVDFPEAVKSHMVTSAYLEIILWRDWMGAGTMIRTAYETLLATGDALSNDGPLTRQDIIDGFGTYTELTGDGLVAGTGGMDCGLGIYSVLTCPMTAWKECASQHDIDSTLGEDIFYKTYAEVEPLRPAMKHFFNESSEFSFINDTMGISRWLVICNHLGLITFENNIRDFIMVSEEWQENVMDETVNWLLDAHLSEVGSVTLADDESQTVIFGPVSALPNPHIVASRDDKLLAISRVTGIALWLQKNWVTAMSRERRENVLYKEFQLTDTPVSCNPLGTLCLWQWGYMRKYHNATELSTSQTEDLIGPLRRQLTNPLSMSVDGNGAQIYNTWDYCTNYFFTGLEPRDTAIECFQMSPQTYIDFDVTQPSALWGSYVFNHGAGDPGGDSVNKTMQETRFKDMAELDPATKMKYTLDSCNVSTLMHTVYKEATYFHRDFIIDFMNRNRDPYDSNFTHQFTDQWDELGYAQWGGGYITQSIIGVRALFQVKRLGMWWIGRQDFHERYLEFATWGIMLGYPHAKLNTVEEAKLVLDTLARRDRVGQTLRHHLTMQATTWRGDGNGYMNGIGADGEVVYAGVVDGNPFACDAGLTHVQDGVTLLEADEDMREVCRTFNRLLVSDPSHCQYIQSLYDDCKAQTTNRWLENCGIFATSISNAEPKVIPCDDLEVKGKAHPNHKKVGTMMYQMLFSLTQQLVITSNLWCMEPRDCTYDLGGMFIVSSVKKLLFEGMQDPSYIKYYNMKHAEEELRFQCVDQEFDSCGRELYNCTDSGVEMSMPGDQSYVFRYGTTPADEFFAPEVLYSKAEARLLWPHSMDPTRSAADEAIIKEDRRVGTRDVVSFVNPHWTAFPDFHTGNETFNRFIQSQRRMFSGMPNVYNSDVSRMDTGEMNFEDANRMTAYFGNATFFYMKGETGDGGVSPGGGAERLHQQAFMWNAQHSFPYPYVKALESEFSTTELEPVVFSKLLGLPFSFSQRGLTQFTRMYTELNGNAIEIPMRESKTGTENVAAYEAEGKRTATLEGIRKFVETADTWARIQPVDDGRPVVGTAAASYTLNVDTLGPKDSYGMPYRVPLDMVPLENLADLPLFASSSHMWINKRWVANIDNQGQGEWIGDGEYAHCIFDEDDQPAEELHQSFIDVDPVTGRTYRQALRQQINVRIERSPLFNNIISSQGRCSVPGRVFTSGSGYGCFSYVPVLWFEEARVIKEAEVFRLEDHFYTRRDRYLIVMVVGIVVGIICITVGVLLLKNESYHRNRFTKRVYVD